MGRQAAGGQLVGRQAAGGQAAGTPRARTTSTARKTTASRAPAVKASKKSPGVGAAQGAEATPPTGRVAGRWTAQTRTRFLEALADLGQVRAAARAAGVSAQTAYRKRRKSPTFARAWQEAMDQALDALEETLIDRAINGVEKPVYYGGRSCGSVRQYSDALAMFLLRARRPETYGRALPSEPPAGSAAIAAADPVALIEARLKALRPPDGPAETPAPDSGDG